MLNSVSFVDGKRYNDCRKTYRALQKASDTLCRDHGLSVVEDPSRHRTPRNLFQAEKAGEPTRYNVMRQDIDRAVLECNHFQELPTRLSKMGYEVNFSPNHKYATIKMPGDTHAVRFKTLGERYTEEALFDRVCENTVYSSLLTWQERYRRCYPPVHPHDRWKQEEFKKALLKTLGIYRTYLYYCYLLGRLPEKIPNHRPPHPAMREDLRHWEQIEAPSCICWSDIRCKPGRKWSNSLRRKQRSCKLWRPGEPTAATGCAAAVIRRNATPCIPRKISSPKKSVQHAKSCAPHKKSRPGQTGCGRKLNC